MSGIRNIRRVTTYDASIPYTNNVQVNGATPVYPVNVNGIPVTNTNLIQVGAAVWWGAQIDAKVRLVEENRRYIQEVVIPSYEISDNWDNPHYNNWLKAGGWKDK